MPYKPPPLLRNDKDVTIAAPSIGEVLQVSGLTPEGNPEFDLAAIAGGFESVPVSMAEADWDTAGAVGTWVFNPDGSISQTDNDTSAAGSPTALLTSIHDEYALTWALQADVRMDALDTTNSGWAIFYAGFDVNAYSNAGAFQVDGGWADYGVGIAAGPDSEWHSSAVYGALGFEGNDAIFDNQFHTVTGILYGSTVLIYADGTLVGRAGPGNQGINSQAFNTFTPVSSRFCLNPYWHNGADIRYMAATFANLKAWRMPIPVLA